MLGIVPKWARRLALPRARRLQHFVVSKSFVANNPTIKFLLEHPAGPFTIHFWAPTCKWAISIANMIDISRPVEKMSISQQTAVSLTGVLWSFYSMMIVPRNWNLFSVNVAMSATGLYQLSRVIRHGMMKDKTATALPPAEASA